MEPLVIRLSNASPLARGLLVGAAAVLLALVASSCGSGSSTTAPHSSAGGDTTVTTVVAVTEILDPGSASSTKQSGEPNASTAGSGEVIEPLVFANDDAEYTGMLYADSIEDNYVGLLVAGGCKNAWSWNASSYNERSDYETYASTFCDPLAGAMPTRDYVGARGEDGDRWEHTVGYRVDDRFLLLRVFSGLPASGSILTLDWASEPHDLEVV